MFCIIKPLLIDNSLSIIFILSTICWKTCVTLNTTQLFIRHQVIPNMVPYAPDEICQVVFPTKTNISIGHSYFVYQISGKPNVTWKANKDKFYTLYLSGATHKEIIYPDRALIQADNFLQFPNTRWVQWLICNIHGSNLSTGIELIPHGNFSEPENPAVREVYFYFILEQKYEIYINLTDKKFHLELELRSNFAPITRFMEKHNSTIVAANFFYLANEPMGINDHTEQLGTETTEHPKISMIETLLKKHHILPDLIPHPPDQICTVKFIENLPALEPGKKYNQTFFATKEKPKVHWKTAGKSYYTLYFFAASEYSWFFNESTNTTTPSPPTGFYKSEWIMWLVGNIPGNNITAGQTIYEFSPLPLPTEDFAQLYILFIFKQPRKIKFPKRPEERENAKPYGHDYTPIYYFMQRFDLVFNLEAANFFFYENDYWSTPANESMAEE